MVVSRHEDCRLMVGGYTKGGFIFYGWPTTNNFDAAHDSCDGMVRFYFRFIS